MEPIPVQPTAAAGAPLFANEPKTPEERGLPSGKSPEERDLPPGKTPKERGPREPFDDRRRHDHRDPPAKTPEERGLPADLERVFSGGGDPDEPGEASIPGAMSVNGHQGEDGDP
jgi:hypothetical protein